LLDDDGVGWLVVFLLVEEIGIADCRLQYRRGSRVQGAINTGLAGPRYPNESPNFTPSGPAEPGCPALNPLNLPPEWNLDHNNHNNP